MITKDLVNWKLNNTHRPIKRNAHLGMHVFPIPFPIGARYYNQCKPVFSTECFRIADSTDMSGLPFKTMCYLLRIRIKYE